MPRWRITSAVEAEALRQVLAKIDAAIPVIEDTDLAAELRGEATAMRTALLEWDRDH